MRLNRLPVRTTLVRTTLAALGCLIAGAAVAGPADEAYIAARNGYVAAIAAAEAKGTNPDAVYAQDEKARAELLKRISALIGPVSFKGLQATPTFSPGALFEGDLESGRPDGLLFHDSDDHTRIFVSTEPVVRIWLSDAAKGEGAPAAFAQGLPAALGDDAFVTQATGSDAAFATVMPLSLAERPGEAVKAALGLFAQDDAPGTPPQAIIVSRIANGRVMVAVEEAPEADSPIPACAALWKTYADKAERLRVAAQKGKGLDDPKWTEATKVSEDGQRAFNACYAGEAPKQPFFAPLMARAEALLARMRG